MLEVELHRTEDCEKDAFEALHVESAHCRRWLDFSLKSKGSTCDLMESSMDTACLWHEECLHHARAECESKGYALTGRALEQGQVWNRVELVHQDLLQEVAMAE